MMDPEDIYHAMFGALTDHAKKQEEDAPRIGSMLPISPFDAETADNDRVRVVGLVTNPAADCIDFIVLKALEDGEMIAVTEGSVWPVKKESPA